MIRYTLLQLVQKVLSSMDGDEVNSISDTTESLQVADCAEVIYNDLITQSDIPEQYSIFNLDASGDPALPIIMSRPDGYETIDWIKYKHVSDDGDIWTPIQGILLDEFLKRQDGLNPDDDGVDTLTLTANGMTMEVRYYNDRDPDWYTTFDDNTIIFSSFNLAEDTTLQSVKTLAYGQRSELFVPVDAFTPAFDSNMHQLWLHETKALASAELRQVPNMKAEQKARKGWIKLQDMKQAINTGSYYNKLPNYGRK
jgi:hypothetical protein